MSAQQQTGRARQEERQEGMGVSGEGLPQAIPGLEQTSWQPAVLECWVEGELTPLRDCLEAAVRAVEAHDDAWPFRAAVSLADAPDYYKVIQDPVDLSLVRQRLGATPPYYVSVDMLLADLCRMCENCRVYNGENNIYHEAAVRLEAYARGRCARITVVRKALPRAAESGSAA